MQPEVVKEKHVQRGLEKCGSGRGTDINIYADT